MTRAKKNIKIDRIKALVNHSLRQEALTQEAKEALCQLLEGVLMETGNYNGFYYLGWVNGGSVQWEKDGRPQNQTLYLGPEFNRVYY